MAPGVAPVMPGAMVSRRGQAALGEITPSSVYQGHWLAGWRLDGQFLPIMANKKPGAKYQHLGIRVEINNKKTKSPGETICAR